MVRPLVLSCPSSFIQPRNASRKSRRKVRALPKLSPPCSKLRRRIDDGMWKVKFTFSVVESSLLTLESICRLFGVIPTLVACESACSLTATLLFRYPLAPHIFEIFAYVVQISVLVNSTPFSLDGGIIMCHNICISTDHNDHVTICCLNPQIPLVGSNPNSGNSQCQTFSVSWFNQNYHFSDVALWLLFKIYPYITIL